MAVTVDATKGAYIIPALAGSGYVPIGGGTMTGALTLPAGAVGAPSLMLDGAGAATGIYSVGANDISFAVNGSRRAFFSTSSFTSTGTIVGSGGLTITNGNCGVVSASGGITWGTSGSADTYIYRDAAATLAQRNGTNAQTLRVYGTYTDSSNYERLSLSTTAGSGVTIAAETLGTGGDNLDIILTPAGTGSVRFPGSTVIASNGEITCPTLYAQTSAGFGLSQFIGKAAYKFGWTDSTTISGTLDTALLRGAAGQVDVTNGTAGTWRDLKLRNLLAGGGNGSYVQTPSMTVANLAAAATAGAGARAFVTDANATTFLSTVAAGGANKVPVVSDGTNWLIG